MGISFVQFTMIWTQSQDGRAETPNWSIRRNESDLRALVASWEPELGTCGYLNFFVIITNLIFCIFYYRWLWLRGTRLRCSQTIFMLANSLVHLLKCFRFGGQHQMTETCLFYSTISVLELARKIAWIFLYNL